MKDEDIDGILNRAAANAPPVDPALLERVSGSIRPSMQPVRPVPSRGRTVIYLTLIATLLAIAGGMILGPHGIKHLNWLDATVIFSAVAILLCAAALICFAEMTPGSPQLMRPWQLCLVGCIALTALFGTLFHDYRIERFVPQGMACLTAGLAQAVPALLAGWLILHRGFAVNPVSAGAAKGILAGMAGLAMLEIHCANFEAPHVMVWHVAVLPLSAGIGALVSAARR